MKSPRRLIVYLNGVLASLALLLCSGCITVPKSVYQKAGSYPPIPADAVIDASATIEVSSSLDPAMRSMWKKWMNSDGNIENYLESVADGLRNDLRTGGLFARIVPEPGAPADYHVKVVLLESKPSDFRVSITITVTNKATGAVVSTHTCEHSYGTSMLAVKYNIIAPVLMVGLKNAVVSDLQLIAAQKRMEQEKIEAELFTTAALSDLLVSAEKSVTLARGRNHAIIAAKTTQLPEILRNWKSPEITALVVKIEQTILDLNHECEVAKDAVQQGVADGQTSAGGELRTRRGGPAAPGPNAPIDERRDLSISYRERIELLKPILAALKEELANRDS